MKELFERIAKYGEQRKATGFVPNSAIETSLILLADCQSAVTELQRQLEETKDEFAALNEEVEQARLISPKEHCMRCGASRGEGHSPECEAGCILTLSEVPLDTLNAFAAEKLGWTELANHAVLGWVGKPPVGWMGPFQAGGLIPDFTQPHGIKMLLERMAQNYRIQLSQWSSGPKMNVCCLGTNDGNCFKTQYYAAHLDLGHAVLMAFCASHGFQVEEA